VRLALASDHAAVDERLALGRALAAAGHEVLDLGCPPGASVDYPDQAVLAARAVVEGRAERGIALCGTGIGVSMAANKVHGVRAALVHDEFTAEMSRRHNDANVLCLGARSIAVPAMQRLAVLWLATPFDGGRHTGRVAKIDALDGSRESGGCCA
jgi:RpiB/LacA/LacB family sugar-phosphate isomerase